MDTYRFISSKDIADRLRAIGYEFSAFEAAYLMETCANATFDAKMSDCPVAWGYGLEKRESTHDPLRECIGLQQSMLNLFEREEESVHVVRKMRCAKQMEAIVPSREGPCIDERPRPYSPLAKAGWVIAGNGTRKHGGGTRAYDSLERR